MSSGIITEWFFTKFDFMPIHFSFRSTFASRVAQPVKSYGNILLPFSPNLWLLIVATSFMFVVLFCVTHHIYTSNFPAEKLHRNEKRRFNFLLFTLSKITEPDPLPWFTQRWSTGKYVSALWTIWALIMVLCYTSNLRAHMSSPQYEKSLDTIQDVADNDNTAWLAARFVPVQPLHLENTGQTDGPLYQIAKKAFEAGSYISNYSEAVQVIFSLL